MDNPGKDEVLMAEIRDQLRDQGLAEDTVDYQMADLADEGMFDIPEQPW